MGKLERELKKQHGFQSHQQEVVVGLLRTHDRIHYRQAKFFRDYGLTQPQYNILRILRGEGKPLPVLEVADRMITAVPGITRLIDKLEKRSLIFRKRDGKDRRVWNVTITKTGLKLLSELDEPAHQLERDLCRGLSKLECLQLSVLLEKIRAGLAKIDS
ncbi:MAG: MarR family transcriptional regulator [Pirellulales bacterium]|nr:MarR family transcriptional regulator [Pirellulales bacterium]